MLDQLKEYCDLEKDHFTIITGKKYYEYILSDISSYDIPLKGKSLGHWIPSLDELINNYDTAVSAKELHILFSSLPRYDFNSIGYIPFTNGIYVLFDKTETYEGYSRIVRIGTHTGDDNLKKRLRSHFKSENQRSSIFRKNIGRSILSKEDDPYLAIWNLFHKEESVDELYEKEIGSKITKYLRGHLSFTCFRVNNKEWRKRLEDGIISSLNMDEQFNAPDSWIGNDSPIEDIKSSGLWCIHGLRSPQLNRREFNIIKDMIKGEYDTPNHQINVVKNTSMVIKKEIKITTRGTKVNMVQQYIDKKIIRGFENVFKFVDIVSGDIHRELCLNNSMPTVCNAMYKLMLQEDEIIHKTPSGKSSTIKIRYYKR